MNEHPLIVSLQTVQRDLTSIKARVAEIQRQVATLSLVSAKTYPCPQCQIPFPSMLKCDEHIYRVHEGPEPPQWLEDSGDRLTITETGEEIAVTVDMSRADTVVPAPSAPTAKKGRST